MGLPTTSIPGLGVQLLVGTLAPDALDPVEYTFTSTALIPIAGTAATFATAPETHLGSGATDISLPAGTVLVDGTKKIILRDDVFVSASPVNTVCIKQPVAVPANNIFKTLALLSLFGIETSNYAANRQMVSSRGAENGRFSLMELVSLNPQLSMNYNIRIGDPALKLLKPGTLKNDKYWVQYIRPDGEYVAGAVKISAFTENQDINNIYKGQLTLDFQGAPRFGVIDAFSIPDITPNVAALVQPAHARDIA